MNNIYFIVAVAVAGIIIFTDICKKKIQAFASFWWSVVWVIMLLLAIFPHSIDTIAGWVGVSYAPALFLTFCILFLLFMVYRQNKVINDTQNKVHKLEQELILEKKKNEKKNEKK